MDISGVYLKILEFKHLHFPPNTHQRASAKL